MKQYTKTITVQAVQWTGNVDDLMAALGQWGIAKKVMSDEYQRN